jgi:hypothetical protein
VAGRHRISAERRLSSGLVRRWRCWATPSRPAACSCRISYLAGLVRRPGTAIRKSPLAASEISSGSSGDLPLPEWLLSVLVSGDDGRSAAAVASARDRFGLADGLAVGSGGGLSLGLADGLAVGSGGGLSLGLGDGLSVGSGGGLSLGLGDGLSVGSGGGLSLGLADGLSVGSGGGLSLGLADGLAVGSGGGLSLGLADGLSVGSGGGLSLGLADGLSVGSGGGLSLGLADGLSVGSGGGLGDRMALLTMLAEQMTRPPPPEPEPLHWSIVTGWVDDIVPVAVQVS